ncbi:hypothetical protein, partial [Streptomyces zinciresistens]|uniref:hypothetical protein n=1 Tax=Streptomyces zinciresistens TaxID=1073330 RepID=UPI001AD807AA
ARALAAPCPAQVTPLLAGVVRRSARRVSRWAARCGRPPPLRVFPAPAAAREVPRICRTQLPIDRKGAY